MASLNSSTECLPCPTTTLNLDLGSTYGALFIGLIVSAVLFGITNLQVFVYSQKYGADIVWSKLAVAWLWVLDAFHLALISHAVYNYLVSDYANPLALDSVVWSFHLQLVIGMTTIVTVHVLYNIRLWRLAGVYKKSTYKTKIIPIIVTVLIVAETGICIAASKSIYSYDSFTDVSLIKWAIIAVFTTASVVDAIIAASLCFTLARMRTGISQTDSLINTIMLFVLNSGVLTSLCSILSVVIYWAYPHNFVFLAVDLLLTKLYVNSFLAMFNARHRLKNNNTSTHKSIDVSVGSKPDAPIALHTLSQVSTTDFDMQKSRGRVLENEEEPRTFGFSQGFSESNQRYRPYKSPHPFALSSP